jgi:hypothetical protein
LLPPHLSSTTLLHSRSSACALLFSSCLGKIEVIILIQL